jgi:hypothetical protein
MLDFPSMPTEGERLFTAIIEKEDDTYVALCPELDIASQGGPRGTWVDFAFSPDAKCARSSSSTASEKFDDEEAT